MANLLDKLIRGGARAARRYWPTRDSLLWGEEEANLLMDRSQTGEGRQVLGAGEVHGNNPPQQPSSQERLDDLRMRGEGNLLGFGKH